MSNELEQIKNILANFAVHVNKCHKDGSEPNLNPWADLFESLLSKQREELVKQVEGLKKKHRITSEEHGFVQSNEVINIIDNVLSLLKGDV